MTSVLEADRNQPMRTPFPAKAPVHDGNLLIRSFAAEEREPLVAASTTFEFGRGFLFCEAGDTVCDVVFPDRGVISAVSVMEDGRTVETCMIGREGVTHPIAPDAVSRCHSRIIAQTSGAIRYSRGRVLVVDRTALERAACECYRVHAASLDEAVTHPRLSGG